MTFRMTFRSLAIPLAALASATGLSMAIAPATALAQGSNAYFHAELAAPAEDARIVAGGVLWNCEGTSCTAPRTGKRPMRVCRDLFREAGEVSSFTVDGEALEDDRLARCNR